VSALSQLGEGPEAEDQSLVQARGHQEAYLKRITRFIDEFLAKLSPVAMTVLKKLWAKKYRKLGMKEDASLIREAIGSNINIQVDPAEQAELQRHGVRVSKGMAFINSRDAARLIDSIASDQDPTKDVGAARSIVRQLSHMTGRAMPNVAGPQLQPAGEEMDISYTPSAVPGSEAAAGTDVETASVPGLMDRDAVRSLYQRVGYSPDPGGRTIPAPPPAPELEPVPDMKRMFRPRSLPAGVWRPGENSPPVEPAERPEPVSVRGEGDEEVTPSELGRRMYPDLWK